MIIKYSIENLAVKLKFGSLMKNKIILLGLLLGLIKNVNAQKWENDFASIDDSYLYNKMYYLDKESFIISDNTDSKHPIKKFNNTKVLVNVIKAGNGPGELSNTMYKTIVSDTANKLIHIWDQAKQVLNTYNFKLEHIDSFSPSGTYKNLAMWLEYKKQIVYINNNAEYL